VIACSRCATPKPETEYHRNASKATGRESECRTCYQGRKLVARYGITGDQYDQMYAAQDGKCRICGLAPGAGRRLAVDHSHATGQVRQLLCSNCNTALGLFKDDPDLMIAAARYVGTAAAA
jgi:hypothetical protein